MTDEQIEDEIKSAIRNICPNLVHYELRKHNNLPPLHHERYFTRVLDMGVFRTDLSFRREGLTDSRIFSETQYRLDGRKDQE